MFVNKIFTFLNDLMSTNINTLVVPTVNTSLKA